MTGYHEPSRHFSVEFYKHSWIMRAYAPADLPASDNPEAMRAVDYWRASNLRKYHEVKQ